MINADLTRECTIRLIEDILRRDGNLLVREAGGEKQVDGRWGDDDLCVGVEFGAVEVGDDFFGGLGGSVPEKMGIVRCNCKEVRVWDSWGLLNVVSLLLVVYTRNWGVDGWIYILKFPPTKNWRGILDSGVLI